MVNKFIGKKGSLTRLRTTLIVVLLLIFGIGVYLAFRSETSVIWAEKTRVGTDKKIMALAGSKRLEGFFSRIEADLYLLAHIISQNEISTEGTKELFEKLLNKYQLTPLKDLVLTDKQGSTTLSVQPGGVKVGGKVDLSDRDYFKWAKDQENSEIVFLSEPIVARGGYSKGKKGIALVIPVFQKEKFTGVLLAGLNLDLLLNEYVMNLAVYSESEVMLVSENGEIISGLLEQDLTGKNLKDLILQAGNASKRQEYETLLSEVLSGKNSWVEIKFLLPERYKQGWIAGFAAMEFGGQKWRLVTLISQDEAFGRIYEFRKNIQYSVVTLGLSVLVVGIISIFSMRRAQLLWFEKGFYSAQMKRVKRKIRKRSS